MEMNQSIIEKIQLLQAKYAAMGQDLESYLDGLLYADYLTYWDYIHLDTLLSLQSPITPFPDEEIFIMYHQITELYFKLALHEFKQIGAKQDLEVSFVVSRINRVNRYFEALTKSFDIMVDGMERDQFLKFRMSLLPASGFQSAQYRMIEIWSTSFDRLVDKDERENFPEFFSSQDIPEMYKCIYWNKGATELSSGNKTLTLRQFEKKYSKDLIELAQSCMTTNVWSRVQSLPEEDQKNPELIIALKWLDTNVNVNWPLAHYKSAVRYLQKDPEDIAATGGTNWQKYLPPRFQKRIFFPQIWSDEELANWGKGWVEKVVFNVEK
ncbi:MAG: tryptophan 2,3-dioxygenase [Flavobacteriales bacterium]|jgi:tryptophan 2,3-dioxygenase